MVGQLGQAALSAWRGVSRQAAERGEQRAGEIVVPMELETPLTGTSPARACATNPPCAAPRWMAWRTPAHGHARPAAGRRGPPRVENAARGPRGLRQRIPGDPPSRWASDGPRAAANRTLRTIARRMHPRTTYIHVWWQSRSPPRLDQSSWRAAVAATARCTILLRLALASANSQMGSGLARVPAGAPDILSNERCDKLAVEVPHSETLLADEIYEASIASLT